MLRFAAILTMAALLPAAAHAQPGKAAVGIIMGEPTGVNLKTWLSEETALAGAAAWSFANNQKALHLHCDYLNHIFSLFEPRYGRAALFYGFGVRVKTERDTRGGIRIPFGATYIFEGVPLDVFFEIVPLLDIVPSTEANFNLGAGIGYYF